MPDLTDKQVNGVAWLLHELRPDWGVPSIKTLLAKNEVPSLGALMIAATTKALEPTCKTPGPIFHPGPHWPEEVRSQIPAGPPCEDHDTFPARNCPCCWADHKVGQRPDTHIGKHWTPETPTEPTPESETS